MFIKNKVVSARVSSTSVEYMIDDLSLPHPTFAFSLRKLKSAYTGDCIRIRRDSDNSEQDIGFAANGGVDTSAISSFVGSDSAYVVTWYDQSGNGYDATQSTQSRQPRIVNAGTIETQGSSGRPEIVFDYSEDSVNDYLQTVALDMADASTVGSTTGVMTIYNAGGTGQVGAPVFQFPGTNWGIGIGDVGSSTGYYDGTWRYVSLLFTYGTMCHMAVCRQNAASGNTYHLKKGGTSKSTATFSTGNANETSQIVVIGSFELNGAVSRKTISEQEIIHWATASISSSVDDIFTSTEGWFGT